MARAKMHDFVDIHGQLNLTIVLVYSVADSVKTNLITKICEDVEICRNEKYNNYTWNFN